LHEQTRYVYNADAVLIAYTPACCRDAVMLCRCFHRAVAIPRRCRLRSPPAVTRLSPAMIAITLCYACYPAPCHASPRTTSDLNMPAMTRFTRAASPQRTRRYDASMPRVLIAASSDAEKPNKPEEHASDTLHYGHAAESTATMSQRRCRGAANGRALRKL